MLRLIGSAVLDLVEAVCLIVFCTAFVVIAVALTGK